MKKPVIVCGANGYTAKLICEYLRHFQVPFIAAGRSHQRVEDAMKLVPGIETAEYEIAELPEDPADLKKLFAGAKVVCNTVGPFGVFSEPIVKAALEAGCHYVDTTGEQAYMLKMRDQFGEEFAREKLLLAPSVAHMSTVLELACNAAAAHEEVDTIEAFSVVTGVPTYGSAQTFIQTVRAPEVYLVNRKLVPWAPCSSAEIRVPFTDRMLLALPWGGSGLPLWYENDDRIRNMKVMSAFTDRQLMEGVVNIYRHYHAELAQLPEADQLEALSKIAAGIQSGTPPRENPLIHRCWDTAIGSGTKGVVRYTMYSNCGYLQTGMLQAFAANWLVRQSPRAFGFRSAVQAFGAESILGALERFGTARLVRDSA